MPELTANNAINLAAANLSPEQSSNIKPTVLNSPEENVEFNNTEEDPRNYSPAPVGSDQANVLNQLYGSKSDDYESLLRQFPEAWLAKNASVESHICFDPSQEPSYSHMESTFKKRKESDQFFTNEPEFSSAGSPRPNNIMIPSPKLTPQKNNLKALDKKSTVQSDFENGNYSSLYQQGETFRNNFYELYLEQCSNGEKIGPQSVRSSKNSGRLEKIPEVVSQLDETTKTINGSPDEESRIVQHYKIDKHIIESHRERPSSDNQTERGTENLILDTKIDSPGRPTDTQALEESIKYITTSPARQDHIPEKAFPDSNAMTLRSEQESARPSSRADSTTENQFTQPIAGNMYIQESDTNRSHQSVPEKQNVTQPAQNLSSFYKSNRSSPDRTNQTHKSASPQRDDNEALKLSLGSDYGVKHDLYVAERFKTLRSSVKSSDPREEAPEARLSQQQSPEKIIMEHPNGGDSSLRTGKSTMPEVNLLNLDNELKTQGNPNTLFTTYQSTGSGKGDRIQPSHFQSEGAAELDSYFKNMFTSPPKQYSDLGGGEGSFSESKRYSLRNNDVLDPMSLEPNPLNQILQESKILTVSERTSPQKSKNDYYSDRSFTQPSPQKGNDDYLENPFDAQVEKSNFSVPNTQSHRFEDNLTVSGGFSEKRYESPSDPRDRSYSPDEATSDFPALKESTNKVSPPKMLNSDRTLTQGFLSSRFDVMIGLPSDQPHQNLENQFTGPVVGCSKVEVLSYDRVLPEEHPTPDKQQKYLKPVPYLNLPEPTESTPQQEPVKSQPAYDYERILAKMSGKILKSRGQNSNPQRQPTDSRHQMEETPSRMQMTKQYQTSEKRNLSHHKLPQSSKRPQTTTKKKNQNLSRSPTNENPCESQAQRNIQITDFSKSLSKERKSLVKNKKKPEEPAKLAAQRQDTNSNELPVTMQNSSAENLARDQSYKELLNKIYSFPISKSPVVSRGRKTEKSPTTTSTLEDDFHRGFAESKDYINRSSVGRSTSKTKRSVGQNTPVQTVQFESPQNFLEYAQVYRAQTDPVGENCNERISYGTTVSEPLYVNTRDKKLNTEHSETSEPQGNIFIVPNGKQPLSNASNAPIYTRDAVPRKSSPNMLRRIIQATHNSSSRLQSKETERTESQRENIFLKSFELAKSVVRDKSPRFFMEKPANNVAQETRKSLEQCSLSKRIAEEITKREGSRKEIPNKLSKGVSSS